MDSNAWLLTWVASLELKRPALIGTPVLDRGDCPMVAWFWLFTSVVSAGVVLPCIPVKADMIAAGVGVQMVGSFSLDGCAAAGGMLDTTGSVRALFAGLSPSFGP
jgi:hypothetical protein